jgi:hypothetical protein
MDDMADPTGSVPVAGRSCGPCSLCCKLMAVRALGKPRGAWCPHAAGGAGCRIYDARPGECRSFACGWLIDPKLGEEWRPSISRIVLVAQQGTNRLVAHVDPGRPDAWRRAPYHARLREWARAAAQTRGEVIVHIGRRAMAILPDHEIDLGTTRDDADTG